MAAYSRGNVVLVSFVFADESGRRRRPAVVISSSAYNRARQEVIVAAITSNMIRRRLFGEHPITDWKTAGLLHPSVVTGIFRTIKRMMIERKLGSLRRADLEAVEQEVRRCLSL